MSLAREKAKAVEQWRRWRNDSVAFVRTVIRAEPEPEQIRILEAIKEPDSKVAVKAGHGVGKSTIAAWVVLWFLTLHDDAKAVATAPSAPQLRDVLMPEISKWHSQMLAPIKAQLIVDSMRVSVRGREKSQFFTARTARAPSFDALQGFHAKNILFILEEMFGLDDKIFEVGRGALSTPGARALGIGNPTCITGEPYRMFHKNRDVWKNFTLSCLNSRLVSKKYVEDMAKEYGEESDIFRVRVLGEFPRQGINQLISRELADEASKRKLHAHQYNFAPKIIGVDPAWEGDDRSVVVLRQGLQVTKLGVFHRINNMELGSRIFEWMQEYKADACFVDVGMGTGVIDFLRQLGVNVIAVNFGATASRDEYHMKRTEMWFEMKKFLESGGALWDEEALVEDLVGPQYFFMPNGKKVLERKKDMKRRGLKSPDLGDAIALTFAYPLAPKIYSPAGVEISSYKKEFAKTDYDVFA